MEDHPPTSIDIYPEKQDDDSTLASIRTVLLKSSDVNPQKDQEILPSGDTTTFHKNPKNPKILPNKEDMTKTNKFTQDFEAEIQQYKTHKQK